MLTLQRILFPTDLSARGPRPFPEAVALAASHGAELRIVTVDRPDADASDGFPVPDDTLASWLPPGPDGEPPAELGTLPIHQERIAAPSPAKGILRYIRQEDIDLVVMGTHGRRGVNRMLFGSVAETVIRSAPCPVLTVRTKRDVDPEHPLQRIVVAIDFSEASKLALHHAREIAFTYGAKLDLLHVVDDGAAPTKFQPHRRQSPEASALSGLEKSLGRLARADVGSNRVQVKAAMGHPPETIRQYAAAHDADLIVLATHGRTGLDRFLLGSVAESVIRQAETPVLVTKPTHGTLPSDVGTTRTAVGT